MAFLLCVLRALGVSMAFSRLHDRCQLRRILAQFWHNSEKRDAVAMRMSVLGKSAHKIDQATERALPGIPFKSIRRMRNLIAHDYWAVDFKVVWAVTQQEIAPLIPALESHFKNRPAEQSTG
ncbi:MAG: DUF86 domain-containing protein [Verrucomicrobia bacterium]|nr:DUF86 domain-containing protein [Verrucomicrobiota bacterium]